MNTSVQIAIAACFLFIGVATGAFGSHALNGLVDVNLLMIWHTSVQYLLIHGVGLLGVALAKPFIVLRFQQLAFALLTMGTLLFSGSLFILVLSGNTRLGMITPIGGLLFLAGWVLVLIGALLGKNKLANH